MNSAMKLYALWYGLAGEGEPSEDSVDWGTLFDEAPVENDIELDEKPEEGSPAPVETPPAEVETPPAPQSATPKDEPKEEANPKEVAVPKVEEEAPKPPVEQPKVLSEAEQQAQLTQFQGELEGMYAIGKEEADMLMTDPEKIMPKLAAKVHLNVMRQVAQIMAQYQQALPEVVEQTSKVVKKKEEAANEFSTRWPGLTDSVDGQQAAVQAVQLVRSRNPNASLKEVIEQSGRIAYSILGKDVPAQAPAQQKQPPAKPKPHLPAATKSAGNVQTQQLSPEEAFYASLGSF